MIHAVVPVPSKNRRKTSTRLSRVARPRRRSVQDIAQASGLDAATVDSLLMRLGDLLAQPTGDD